MPDSQTFEIDCELEYEVAGEADFLLQIHALRGMDQRVLSESLHIAPPLTAHVYEDPTVHHRFMRLHSAAGPLSLRYQARVQRTPPPRLTHAPERPVAELPNAVLHNLMPTRYCESDLLARAATRIFGALPAGYQRVQAIADWIHDHIDYLPGSTTTSTTACDVFRQRAGVCRDFAHLGITFCRALNIPARLVAGYAQFDEPPADFHAVFEAWLGDGWVMFDATRMADVDDMVRIAVGRDAKDVAFATLFGPATLTRMAPLIRRAG